MSDQLPDSPFAYDSAAHRVRSTDPQVEILCDRFSGGADEYSAYAVAIARAGDVFCFHAAHDYLRDASGKYLLTSDRRPVGMEFTHLRTRWRLWDGRTGEQFASTFSDDEQSYRHAVELAISFYSSARMLRPDAPLRRITFAPSEKAHPMVVEFDG